jgi:hypothetical protein
MTSQEDPPLRMMAHRCDGCLKSFLVSFRTSTRWWPKRPGLTKGKIATKHGQARSAERIGQCCEKQRAAICSGAVRQDQTVCSWNSRPVQKSAHGRRAVGCVNEFFRILHRSSRIDAASNVVNSSLSFSRDPLRVAPWASASGSSRSLLRRASGRWCRNSLWLRSIVNRRCFQKDGYRS